LTALLGFFYLVTLPTAAASGPHHVAPNADCGTVTPCYATLQSAIDAAQPGDEIRVAQGVYTDVTAFEYTLAGWTDTITQAVFIDTSLTVRGGYTITDWSKAQPITYPTVIDPQGRGRGAVVTTPDPGTPITVTLEGLSITHGYAQGSGSGLYVYGASAVISGCYVAHNAGGSIGTGIYLNGRTMTLVNNVVAYNTGPGYGVGIDSGVPTLAGNRITHNSNGLLLWSTVATLTNNLIAANGSEGLSVIGGRNQAWHTTVADNGTVGVDVMNSGQGAGHLAMTNTIIAGSVTGVKVTGNAFDPSTAQLLATLWDNVTDREVLDGGGEIHSRWDYEGDPAFAGEDDYHLTEASPARNRGWSSPVRDDLDGESRDPMPDLGADEYFDPGSIRQVYLPLIVK
jgi:hypothetical protein